MGFDQFIGNQRIIVALRGMLRSGRVPHALLFSGPRGTGKYTLAVMFAQAVHCERQDDDFCGTCAACLAIGKLADPDPLVAEGLAERGESADAALVERMPLILQTHPDVWALVPDPVRLRTPVARPMIRMGQLRAVQRAAQFRPAGRRRVFVLDGAETMHWNNSDVFLKILEEPPETTTLVLITPNLFGLADTIRSRCMQFHFAPLSVEEIETCLARRGALDAADRRLAAELSGGSPGVALRLDLADSVRLRREALGLLQAALDGRSWGEVLRGSARLAKSEKESFENLLEVYYSFCNDLLELSHRSRSSVLRNPDLRRELEGLSERTSLEWVARAVRALDELHARLRRNINRQLGLDAVAVSLGNGEPAPGPFSAERV